MHIAVLVTNTDESTFAQAWPKDGEKFPSMMRRVRPDWCFTAYEVKDGVFPESLDGIDGVMITGSPSSVNSDAPWVARLLEVIREIYAADVPMIGACFGHQAIAKALGGEVSRNPDGWVHGLVDVNLGEARLPLYASHIEQVSRLPEGADVIATGPGCPVGGFQIGRIMTTQYHPEMEPDFMAALVEELASELPLAVTEAARASMVGPADMTGMAERMALFLEGKSA
ncbi:type 1 glutamine amidotransferase [Lentibacter sp. XHP0401]|jgi:GMP synthase-like glutamine amidotransferase|uniref:type 1 glutamine amidotransferase n=1 Tax=Lentibacter sp. XHP0401 TaxID=2984334 RepID=UPI0021E8474C|nr:type 1 glutamine amidotransferase [Lentibacter sp. XHP0401]MCV2893258.1 type 1 glutamine amidotransferase [Lentibacter sp. XHP0401]